MAAASRTTWLVVASLGSLAVIAGVVFWMAGPGASLKRLDPNDPDIVALGRQVYESECASCHGQDLEGQPDWRTRLPSGRLPAPPHDESGHTWHHPDSLLIELTRFGPASVVGDDYDSDMPAYAKVLSDEEIAAVLSFIKSTWPEHIRDRHDDINFRSE